MPATEPAVQLLKPPPSGCDSILSAEAIGFVTALAHRFEPTRQELLQRRQQRQQEIDAGRLPDFLPTTHDIREREWTVAPIRPDLLDRRVEITGPVDRKMMINAFNSGANVFMADFEDSNAPTWENNVRGQQNLRDAVAGTISYVSPEGKRYALEARTATLMVRPRGWHLVEKHLLVDGRPISAALFDFGLAFFHNAAALIAKGSGPYFYLPKLESHLEARLWNDVFNAAQDALGIARGTIRATVLIETILAAFETDEILWELRDHSAGLNCGRWDYIFSYIKKFRHRPECLLPDRGLVTMDRPFLKSYAELVIRTCHRRGIHALGGMAAQIPIKRDPALNAQAIEKVRQDKLREVGQGHDGTWVAHPGLVPVAREVFDAHLRGPHQIHVKREDVRVTARDLLAAPPGAITEDGLRKNVDVALRYLAAWLGGTGCVPIYDLMEDAATAEISRAQVWQWLRHDARLQSGRPVTATLLQQTLSELVETLPERVGADGPGAPQFSLAGRILSELATGAEFAEFLTTVAYQYLD
ncbi:MAG TPA: malate synthase A, partial [Gemmatimonadales bacterium]|nr:malate synthase A [Gemmatimonadales bacterium]